MQTIGERLEDARKKKGVSIREAAEATKIRGDYLSRFENNQFDINLTELYVRGFLRSYAVFLNLPTERILNDYAALGHGGPRMRQPSREVYGRMEVATATAENTEVATTTIEEPATATAAARRTPATPARSSTPPPVDPAALFKALKWTAGAVAVLLIGWALQSWLEAGPERTPTKASVASPRTAAAPLTAEPGITVIALDAVRLSVKVKNPDGTAGEVLLPDTTLARGERRTVPKRGALYLTATALENVALEENGRTTNIRDQGISGYSRVQIGR